jgi:pantetheine-phosphate adenylyltransferase
MAKAIYPGSFDPLTNGHLDLIERGAGLFEELRVLVAVNSRKQPFLPDEERVAIISEETARFGNVSVVSAEGLTVAYALAEGYDTILRGVRATTDFNSEFQMALTNRSLAPEVETVFVMPSIEWSFVSSTLVREIHFAGGDASAYVPPAVAAALERRRRS